MAELLELFAKVHICTLPAVTGATVSKDELLTIWKAKKKAALHFHLQSKPKADPKTESMGVKP